MAVDFIGGEQLCLLLERPWRVTEKIERMTSDGAFFDAAPRRPDRGGQCVGV